MAIRLRPRALLAGLASTTVMVVVAGTIANLALQQDPEGHVGAVARRLLLDAEATVPAYVSGAVAGLIALLLLARSISTWSTQGRLAGLRWLVLAAGAAWVSLDEVIHTHEEWDDVLRLLIDDPTLDRVWTIPAVVGLVALVGFAFPALRREAAGRWWLLGALVFVAGAVGVEWLSRPYEPPETARLGYVVAVAVEEALELFGLAMIAYAALTPFATEEGLVPLIVGDPADVREGVLRAGGSSTVDARHDTQPGPVAGVAEGLSHRTSPLPRSPGPPAAR